MRAQFFIILCSNICLMEWKGCKSAPCRDQIVRDQSHKLHDLLPPSNGPLIAPVGRYLKLPICKTNRFKSHCLRKPGRAKRWGSADLKDILVMQSPSHMNTNGRGLRNLKCFLSENDHPPRF